MSTVLLKSQVSLWFDYLKLADRMGLRVDWGYYKPWGTREEIRDLKFGTWWRLKGKALFEQPADTQISVTKVDGGFVHVKIPAYWTVRKVRREVGPVFAPVRSKNVPKGIGGFVIRGRFSYGDFVSYKRLLELDLNARAGGSSEKMGSLLRTFRVEERRRKEKAAVATQTSSAKAAARGKRRHRKFRAVEVKVTANEQRNGYIWLKKAKRIAENVATGVFPGGGR